MRVEIAKLSDREMENKNEYENTDIYEDRGKEEKHELNEITRFIIGSYRWYDVCTSRSESLIDGGING